MVSDAATGHVHAYERTFPVNNYVVDPCGVRYLTVGDGGNIEGLYKTFAAQPGTCTCTSVQSATAANACPCLAVAPSFQPAVRRPLARASLTQALPLPGRCPLLPAGGAAPIHSAPLALALPGRHPVLPAGGAAPLHQRTARSVAASRAGAAHCETPSCVRKVPHITQCMLAETHSASCP